MAGSGGRAALAESLCKHLRQDWAEFVQGPMGGCLPGPQLLPCCTSSAMGEEEHRTRPWAGVPSQRQGDDRGCMGSVGPG